MSERALSIIGVDEETNLPVRIALTLVLGENEEAHEAKIEAFAAPRGFMPASAVGRNEHSHAAVAPGAFAAPRGFLPAFD